MGKWADWHLEDSYLSIIPPVYCFVCGSAQAPGVGYGALLAQILEWVAAENIYKLTVKVTLAEAGSSS